VKPSFHSADTLQAIYDAIPKIDCQRKCIEACGPILMSSAELIRISAVVKPPTFHPETLTCSKLQAQECSIYSLRPLICRLWGVVKRMRCPFGCQPERWLSERESRELLARAERLVR
jgi:hypothetical protein